MSVLGGSQVTDRAFKRAEMRPSLFLGSPKNVLSSIDQYCRGNESRRSPRTRKLECSALTAVDKLPLSSYDFPRLPTGLLQPTVLELAVKEAVVHLDQAPFLQLQQDQETTRHSVDVSMVQCPQVGIHSPVVLSIKAVSSVLRRWMNGPCCQDTLLAQLLTSTPFQLWRGIAQDLARDGVETVLLLHPLDPPCQAESSSQVKTRPDVISGISRADHASQLQSFAELIRSGAKTADFSGRVGECCDDPPHSQVVAFPRHKHRTAETFHHYHQHQRSNKRADADDQRSRRRKDVHSNESAKFWGVVLQSNDSSSESGCFVLKTSHSGVGDCTCVHWTLTRVCSGAPIFDQVTSAWLVN